MSIKSLSGSSRMVAVIFAVALPIFAADAPQGVTNFNQINDHIYRGAQPSDEGFKGLAKLGVKTIIDLREADGRGQHEKQVVESLGMHYVNIPLAGFSAPSEQQVGKVMALFGDESTGPVFVHCRRGADRTGTMIAIYRMNHDHWNSEKALAEAKAFKMAGWEYQMKSYVRHYQPKMETAGIESPAATVTAQ